jgi:hypothetical protein
MTSLYPILPVAALVLFILTTVGEGLRPSRGWLFAALICALFAAFSLYTVASGGPFGFWPNHTQNAWGNQVWFDLLIAIAIGWTLLLPRARAMGMNPWPWLALTCATGCIGLAAMFARCRYLEARQSA